MPDLSALPERIRSRFSELEDDVNRLVDSARSLVVTDLPDDLRLRIQGWGPAPILSAYEKAQAISFVVRLAHLPQHCDLKVVSDGSDYRFEDVHSLRHVLNEWRPIIKNQNDSVFYTRINSTCQKMLASTNPFERTSMIALDSSGNCHTTRVAKRLGEHCKAIASIIAGLELGYLYDGLLQHADAEYSKRVLDDYTSGEMNYVLMRHVMATESIRELLSPFAVVFSTFSFPSPGSL